MKKPSIVIVDYEMGNIRSIENKINRAGYEAIVTSDKDRICKADKLILPGVGHFANGMQKLKQKSLIDVLSYKVLDKKTPILGICLGMQLLTQYSEEGNTQGLGWLNADTLMFRLSDIRFKVPHIGWNSLEVKKSSSLLEDISPADSFYFVHSFHIKCHDPEDVLTTSFYGYEFVSAIHKSNIFGTQFHPEKSHTSGEKLLKNFLNL